MFVNPAIDLALIAAGFVAVSQAIQVLVMNRKQLRAHQKKSKALMKEQQELMKKGKDAPANELERLQREQMELMQGQFKQMPKMMLASLIVFLPLFTLVQHEFAGQNIPVFFPFSLIWQQLDWYWYYVLCSLIVSVVVGQVLNAYDNHHENKQAKHTATATHQQPETATK
ncbi:MAG: DUF106 domain-containing protein [Candidatus Iainarchaeum archaeon]|uniref:DUF106 domain-containing protein n=1 Tax=Candidatus Iainarchaeum sp. TaxID=3101447 RepID=A0A7T9I229_9ARCH|nr:MAG: DUF106 domain-containing protein [Candidatus Diapherotrites archaeon]